jgi:hypothetical protein
VSAATASIRQDQQLTMGFGNAAIGSDPDGAEIFLDGKNVGMTPATLRIPSGHHVIILRSEQHLEWERSIEILQDSSVTLIAVLKPN